jgi:hypothetical protein
MEPGESCVISVPSTSPSVRFFSTATSFGSTGTELELFFCRRLPNSNGCLIVCTKRLAPKSGLALELVAEAEDTETIIGNLSTIGALDVLVVNELIWLDCVRELLARLFTDERELWLCTNTAELVELLLRPVVVVPSPRWPPVPPVALLLAAGAELVLLTDELELLLIVGGD